MRTVPVVLEIADAVRAHASPDAWIVDFTNPVGIVTRALLDAGHRAVGLCNVAIGFQRDEGFFVQDLGSTNGTLLNGARTQRAALSDGDELQMGKLHLRVGLPGAAP